MLTQSFRSSKGRGALVPRQPDYFRSRGGGAVTWLLSFFLGLQSVLWKSHAEVHSSLQERGAPRTLPPFLVSITHMEYPLSKCMGPDVLQLLDFFQFGSIYLDLMSYLGDETQV